MARPSTRLRAVPDLDAREVAPRRPPPLVHSDPVVKGDRGLRAEASAHLASHATLQVMAEVLSSLRITGVPWWTPEQLRARWPAEARLGWFEQRSDLRQEITTALTGLMFNTARRKSPAFQAELIDAVIEDSDIGAAHFEGAFDPRDLVVYGPVDEMWRELLAWVPWENEEAIPESLVASLLESFVADKSPAFGLARTPILSAWDVRAAIDSRTWNARIPLDVRAAIDDARLGRERERPDAPFHAKDDLAIAVPKVIAASIPIGQLKAIFVAAGEAMGLGQEPRRSDVVPAE